MKHILITLLIGFIYTTQVVAALITTGEKTTFILKYEANEPYKNTQKQRNRDELVTLDMLFEMTDKARAAYFSRQSDAHIAKIQIVMQALLRQQATRKKEREGARLAQIKILAAEKAANQQAKIIKTRQEKKKKFKESIKTEAQNSLKIYWSKKNWSDQINR